MPVSSLKPPGPRSPASTVRRISTVSRTFVSGFSKGIWFQRSTITLEEEPMPRQKRPSLASCSAAACWASTAGPRVNAFTTPVPSRMCSVHAAASAIGVNASVPVVSPLHRSS